MFVTKRTIKPFTVSEKVNWQTKIALVEKGNALSDPEISSEVEKVILYDRGIAENMEKHLTTFLLT